MHPRLRYAQVRWDALTLPDESAKNLRDDAIAVIDAIQGVLRYHEEHGGVKIGGTIGSTVGWLDKVPIDVARMVAGEIFDVLNAAAKRAL